MGYYTEFDKMTDEAKSKIFSQLEEFGFTVNGVKKEIHVKQRKGKGRKTNVGNVEFTISAEMELSDRISDNEVEVDDTEEES